MEDEVKKENSTTGLADQEGYFEAVIGFASVNEYRKGMRFKGRVFLPTTSTDPTLGEVGEIVVVGTTPKICTSTNPLTWEEFMVGSVPGHVLAVDAGKTVTNTTTETTLISATVPGGTLGTDKALRVDVPITDLDYRVVDGSGAGDNLTIRARYGSGINDFVLSLDNVTNIGGFISVLIVANGSTSSQKCTAYAVISDINATPAASNIVGLNTDTSNFSQDSTSDLTLSVTAQWSVASTSNTLSTGASIAQQII